jgi:transposase
VIIVNRVILFVLFRKRSKEMERNGGVHQGGRRQLTSVEVSRAVTLLEENKTQRYVAEQLGVRQSVIWRLWRRFQNTGSVTRLPGQGRHRATTLLDDRFLRLQALRKRTNTARTLQNDLLRARGVQISDQTVRNRLREAGLRSRRPAKVMRLTRNQRQARMHFAQEHHNWQIRHWRRIMFTDESRFALCSNDGRVRVWRRAGERFLPSTVQEVVPFGNGSVMVWGGISIDDKSDLVVIRNGALNARRYIDEVLQTQIQPRAHAGGENFVLMQDNARPHVARIVTDYLQEQNIAIMQWPACSPDMNPIEHLWDELGRRIRNRQNAPITLLELENALLEEWRQIPQENIRRLIRSMPRRCAALIQARGGPTKY